MQVYVNQHDFFINEARNTRPVEDTLLSVYSLFSSLVNRAITNFIRWRTIPDPDSTPPKNELGLTSLFTEIRATVETEAQIVKAVFPNPPFVMQVFLQRVFAQPVSISSCSIGTADDEIGPTTRRNAIASRRSTI